MLFTGIDMYVLIVVIPGLCNLLLFLLNLMVYSWSRLSLGQGAACGRWPLFYTGLVISSPQLGSLLSCIENSNKNLTLLLWYICLMWIEAREFWSKVSQIVGRVSGWVKIENEFYLARCPWALHQAMLVLIVLFFSCFLFKCRKNDP